ncbi:MAG TPA: hypothetical protein VM939_00275 [Gemmatimonadaceae bacterium]|nr:hypothetical protein [Gemmatimonadaceae bacterium]
MAYRRFLDKTGTSWEVWQVVPQNVERRTGERRASAAMRQGEAGFEDRRRESRRVAPAVALPRMTPGFENGWLCFCAGGVNRRLAPIPSRWFEATVAELEQWSRLATPAWKCATG